LEKATAMSDKYRARDVNAAYFVTLTTVGWVDIFTRLNQKLAIVESLRYCQQHKELVIFAWCLMPSHLHLLCRAEGKGGLPDFLRDFKTHTSKQAVRLIMEEPESRREWLRPYLQQACAHLARNQQYKVWQDGNHAEEVFSNKFIYEKLAYIHNNPVTEMVVEHPEAYRFSSAPNYADQVGLLDVVVIPQQLITVR